MFPTHNIDSLITSEQDNSKLNITLENIDDLKSFLCSQPINTKLPSVNLNLMCINIQSIRSNFDALKILLSEINSNVDILILTETWIGEAEVDFYRLPNYKMYHFCRSYNRSGGIMVYIKNVYDFLNLNTSMTTSECVLIYSSKFDLAIYATYRSHAFSINDFNHELDAVLQSLNHSNLVLIGDLNIDILTETHSTADYINLLHEHGFMSMFSIVSRLRSNTCIDHIWHKDVKSNCRDFSTARFICGLTDHLPIFCKINLISSYVAPDYDPKIYRFININSLTNYLCNYKFNTKYLNTDPYNQFNDFHNKIIAIKNNFSFTSVKNKIAKAAKKDWINDEIICMTKIKDKLYKKHVRYPGDNFYKLAYKTTAKVLKRKISHAKNTFYINKLNNFKNSKEQWSFINNILGIQNKTRTLPSYNNELNLANTFNHFFVANSRCSHSDYSNYKPGFPSQLNSFSCLDITSEEIQRCIKKLNAKVSPGFDQINAKTLNIVALFHSDLLANLFNNLLISGIFPDSLKISIVSPIFKKGDPEELQNYRPISVLPLLSKVFEVILKDRLLSFLNHTNFFSENQYGFLPNKSTETALLKFTDFIYRSINSNKITIAIFLDISKAFDTVNHKILLHKLHTIGIRGNYHNLFVSYLSNRQQIVKIGDCYSDMLSINCGVFQGTVLGPLLFLIFINDMCNLKLNGQILTFADDTTLLYSLEGHQNYNKLINDDLIIIRSWFINNSLKLNISKTKFINFNLHKDSNLNFSLFYHADSCNINDHCQCKTIERVNSFKYLGVFVDSNLKWKTHINYVIKRLRFLLYRFKHLHFVTNRKFLLQLYFAWVHPILNYGLSVWGGDYLSSYSVLFSIHNKFIKILNSSHHYDITVYKSLNILPLRYLYLYKICLIIYKNPNCCEKKPNISLRRSNDIYKIPFPYKEIMRKTFSYLGPKMFNSLHPNIQNSPSCNIFKKQLKSFLFSFMNIEQFF